MSTPSTPIKPPALRARRRSIGRLATLEDWRPHSPKVRSATVHLLRFGSWWFICNPREADSIFVRPRASALAETRAVLAFTWAA